MWACLRENSIKEPQVPPLRSLGAPVGMTILLCAQQLRRESLGPCQRIVIPTGAPKERSGGTCGFFPKLSRRLSSPHTSTHLSLLRHESYFLASPWLYRNAGIR